jgi:hypothetical protein
MKTKQVRVIVGKHVNIKRQYCKPYFARGSIQTVLLISFIE